MKVRQLRATLEEFERMFSDCSRLPEANMLRQLNTILNDHESSSVSGLVDKIRASRPTSGRNHEVDSLSN